MNVFEDFKQYLVQNDLSALTVRGYLGDLEQFARWFGQTNGEAFSLSAVTPTDLRAYRQFVQITRRCKAATVNRKLAALAAFFRWARQDGRVTANPCEQVKAVQQAPASPRWLDRHEQFALLRAIEKDLQLSKLRYPKRWLTRRRDASLILVLLHTGLRLGEVTALRLDDVRLSERRGSLLVRQGKGNKQRLVPLNSGARQALEAWLAVRPAGVSDSLWVAVEAEARQSLSGRAVQRALSRLGQEAGLERLSAHMLRHCFAKNLVEQGAGLEKVAALLGHASLNTTRVYVTPDRRDLELAVERLAG